MDDDNDDIRERMEFHEHVTVPDWLDSGPSVEAMRLCRAQHLWVISSALRIVQKIDDRLEAHP